mgnify:CR=1 FL=1
MSIIGIMSDTHDNIPLTERAIEKLNEMNVDLVVHCGDIISPFIMKRLSKLKSKLIAVYGNNDGDKDLLKDIALNYGFELHNPPYPLTINGKRILILHGFGSKEETKRIVHSIAKSREYDIILYGHTHEREYKVINDVVVLNPGEVFGYLSGTSTIAILDLVSLKATFIQL